MMEYYRYSLKILTPLATELKSDILAGHLLWAIRRLEGREALRDVIDFHARGQAAPFIIGNPVPEGFLPRPHLPVPRIRGDVDTSLLHKRLKKMIAVRAEMLREYTSGGLLDLIDREQHLFGEKAFIYYSEMHNAIDRETGRVADQKLYSSNRLIVERGTSFDLFVAIRPDFGRDRFEELINHVAAWGYGADSSTGCGKLDIGECVPVDDMFRPREGDNAWLLLSYAASDKGLPLDRCLYEIETRFGRLYHDESLAADGIESGNIFKQPLMRVKPGAVSDEISQWATVTCPVHGTSADGVVDFAFPLWMPIRLSNADLAALTREVDA